MTHQINELFPAEETASLSPRLRWMRKHNVSVKFNSDAEPYEPWEAYIGRYDPMKQLNCSGELEGPFMASGDCEHDAIVKLAVANGWKLWNEE